VGVAFQFVATIIIWRLIDVSLEDRERTMRRRTPESPGEMTGLYGFLVRRALESYVSSSVVKGSLFTASPFVPKMLD